MKRIDFSVLRYYPSFITGECINLGILIYCAEDNFIRFEHINHKHHNRLRTFDDELDISMVAQMLDIISEDIKAYSLPLITKKSFDLKEYIKYFTNEFRFSSISSVDYESTDIAVKELTDICLRLYYPKNERPDKTIERNYIERVIKTNHCEYTKNQKAKDDFGFTINYDFMIDNKTGIKYFNIKSESINKMVNHLRSWAWNGEHSSMESSIIVYSCDDSSKHDPVLLKALEILKSETQYVVNIDALASLLKTLKTSTKTQM